MHMLPAVWLPILVAAIGVFVASALIHMLFRWHHSDFRRLPDEDAAAAALRSKPLPPGQYTLPYCDGMKEMQTEEMQKRYRDGPIAVLIVRKPGIPGMGPILFQWFLLNLAIATIAAMLVLQVVGLQAHPHAAGHLVGMISLLAYGCGSVTNGIWFAKPWGTVAKDLLDALIYGTVSAFAFVWLWP
ncbi:hypothetical protein [Arenimonas sp.]|uniref:hypothetical protein n=1 Tax=Arenimonas sp. TaxID=1872635 RepID=UPI0039E30166